MRQYPIRSRYISLLLLVAMFFSLVPTMQLAAQANMEGANPNFPTIQSVVSFKTAATDGITMLNNGNNISMSIRTNNFVLDGMLFDYLSSTRSADNAHDYRWEYSKDNTSDPVVQLYPYKLRNQDLGQGARVPSSSDKNYNSNTPNAYQHGLVDADGFTGVQSNGTLDSKIEYSQGTNTYDDAGRRSDGKIATRTVYPNTYTEKGRGLSSGDYTSTAFLRMNPTGERTTYGNNTDGTGKGRAWTKLTTLFTTRNVEDIRYAVLIYRLPNGSSITNTTTGEQYTSMGLTVNSFDEVKGNCSRYVPVQTSANSNWQYAIIDLMGLSSSDNRHIKAGTKVNEVYLQLPLTWYDTGNCMDLAAVAYFPYYGDAEQFAYYGLTMGCQQKYFNANNASFSLRNNTNTHKSLTGDTRTQVLIKSLPTYWQAADDYAGARQLGISTYSSNVASQKLEEISNLMDEIGNNLFGTVTGEATLGLVETALGEDGRPVFKESVIRYLALYLRHQLLSIPEYPYDNNGWRNYSFITGVSTSGATNEALFGTDEYGRSLDLASALCKQLGVKKGGAVKSGTTGAFGHTNNPNNAYYDYSQTSASFGSHSNTLAHKSELIGTWDDCKKNIKTWYDAAYYLLNNLYVTETDTADTKVDGYGEFEDDYQTLILPQVQYKDGTTPYFFDSGYAYYTDIDDASTYKTALTLDKTQHTISMNGDAQGLAMFRDGTVDDEVDPNQILTSYFPFLITSGNGTAAGESNSSYYLHDGVLSRAKNGTTYRSRDFHYAMTGNGYFAYEPGLYFNFQGDDDVFVYINGELVIDLGGTHGAARYEMKLDDYVSWAKAVKNGTKTYKGKSYSQLTGADKNRVDALCLVTGGVYSFDFFYMERHGVGSNLRIMTNMKIVESNLGVDKFAYQNGIEVIDNGMVNVDDPIEYGFSITNNSDGKLYNLSFSDTTIGVIMDSENGLQVTGNVTDALGAKLTPASLVITVDGYDENGDVVGPINVSCPNNESLIQFLKSLSSEGTQGGNAEEDYDQLYAGSGLWKDAVVTIRGMYYELTDAQKKVNSFTNSVVGTGFTKVPGENGGLDDCVLRGVARHTVYQPGQPAYYQWVGHPIIVESEQLYNDLITGNIVESAADLPKPSDMILIPSNSGGTEIASSGISNVPGGDVYLKINYTDPGSYMAYVTIHDAMNPDFSITVPITVYAMGGQDSTFVLDYGLDTYLTDHEAIFGYELGAAAGNVTGSVLGISNSLTGAGYVEYDEETIMNSAGQLENQVALVIGTYDGSGDHTEAVYGMDTPVYLDHNKPWVIEWKASHPDGVLLFAQEQSAPTLGNMYVYLNINNGLLFMGHVDVPEDGSSSSKVYNNHGVYSALIKNSKNVTTEYKMVNVPDGAGGNTVHAYVNEAYAGAMVDYYIGGATTATTKNKNWISGKDFTFNFFGSEGHGMDGIYEYIRVYEDGYQLTHSKWEMPGTQTAVNKTLNTVSTGEVGYVNNTATYGEYTVIASGNHKNYWTLSEPVTLAHDQNWEFVMTAENIHKDTIIMSAKNTSSANATHIFHTTNADGTQQFFHMGYRNPTGGSHTNFGVDVAAVIPGFSFMDKHTYVLKNLVLPTGGNMVYLYVDDIYIGPLNNRYRGGYSLQATNTTEISGLDFTFHMVACDNSSNVLYGFFDDTKIYNLEIRSKIALHNSYEWTFDGYGVTSTVATDNKGNQIQFTNDSDGVVTDGDGTFSLTSKGLKFSVNEIMDDRYSAYIAMAIHEKGFAPTALAVDGIDITKEAQMYKKVTVLPASVVYYEDDFPAIHYYGTAKNSFAELGNVTNDYSDYSDTYYHHQGSSDGLTQSPDQDTPYGSDGVYQNAFTNTSGGSLHTIAINNDGPLAWFQFKGTGFELDARTTATDSGMLFVEIYSISDVFSFDANGNPAIVDGFVDGIPLDIIPVIPQFDQGNVIDDQFQAANGGSETIYQVPIMECADLEYGEYIVVICGSENIDYSNTGLTPDDPEWNSGVHKDGYLYLDGIRIYNPLGTDVSEYGDEQSMIIHEVRDQITSGNILVSDFNESGGVHVGTALTTWTEKYNDKDYTGQNTYVGHAVNNVNDYLMDGPNNEVYMDGTFHNGALVLYVRQESGTDNILQLGVRALDMGLYFGAGSTGMRANLMLGIKGTTVTGETENGWYYIDTVTSGTEQFYNIPYTLSPVVDIDGVLYHQVVIKATGYDSTIPAMVSFTNIKRSEGLAICESQFLSADQVDAEGNLKTGSVGYSLLSGLSMQMSAYRNFTINEAEPGSNFVVETPEVPENPENPDEKIPNIIPGYPSLAFEGEVRYNIYFDIENMEDVALEDMGLITFSSRNVDGTIYDAVDVVPGALFSGSNYMVHTNGIAAKNLGDTLYFKVYAKLADGSYIYSSLLNYSALAYAENRLANSTNPELQSLVVAMLNYGAAAQQFFGYRTDALMNAGLTDEQKALASAYSADMATPVVKADASKVGTFASTGGFTTRYASVSFTGAFMLNYYFTPDKAVEGSVTMYSWDADTYNSVNELTAENATQIQSMSLNEAGEYVGTVTGMAAKEVGETVYVAVVYQAGGTTYCSGVVAYNIDSYCAGHAANSASGMQELAAATTVYGYYAKNYFAN